MMTDHQKFGGKPPEMQEQELPCHALDGILFRDGDNFSTICSKIDFLNTLRNN